VAPEEFLFGRLILGNFGHQVGDVDEVAVVEVL